jgi:type II secretory pathway predicted ATPase ExeA
MAGPLTLTRAVAQLRAHPPRISDVEIAARATALLRQWGVSAQKDRVSRTLACKVRRGMASKAAGVKARAVWETLVALRLIPSVPVDVLSRHEPTPQRLAGRAYYWKRQCEALRARLAGGELSLETVTEVPMLTTPMLRYFGFTRNPVFDEILSERDVWWGAQHKEARAELVAAAESARFVRLAGPRGAGKSLVAQAAQKALEQRADVVVVEPSPTITGVLTETHLITAVIQAIKRRQGGRDEVYAEAQSPAKRALTMRYLLVQQRRENRKVVLWIDEAHELKAGTFLALKRFLDEVDGIGRRLLGVILIGQNPEAAYNPRARDLSEVTLRMQTYRLGPMHDEIPDYLRFKIQRAGATVGEVITPAAVKAIAARCPFPLDANALFAQLLIDAYGDKRKPIARDALEALPEAEAAVAAAGAE